MSQHVVTGQPKSDSSKERPLVKGVPGCSMAGVAQHISGLKAGWIHSARILPGQAYVCIFHSHAGQRNGRLKVCQLCLMAWPCAGSRSSPLTAAVAMQPRACIIPCIDERSLGFWAVGHAKATGYAPPPPSPPPPPPPPTPPHTYTHTLTCTCRCTSFPLFPLCLNFYIHLESMIIGVQHPTCIFFHLTSFVPVLLDVWHLKVCPMLAACTGHLNTCDAAIGLHVPLQ